MPTDLRDFKRVEKKIQCFKTGIRNDFPWKRHSTGHHEDVRDKVQKYLSGKLPSSGNFLFQNLLKSE